MGCENRALKLDGVKTSALHVHVGHQKEGTIHKTDNASSTVRRIH
jgi:hypothetical protein